MTISVPEGLKERMDNYPEKVNWSEIAQNAFKAYLQGSKPRKFIIVDSDNNEIVGTIKLQ